MSDKAVIAESSGFAARQESEPALISAKFSFLPWKQLEKIIGSIFIGSINFPFF